MFSIYPPVRVGMLHLFRQPPALPVRHLSVRVPKSPNYIDRSSKKAHEHPRSGEVTGYTHRVTKEYGHVFRSSKTERTHSGLPNPSDKTVQAVEEQLRKGFEDNSEEVLTKGETEAHVRAQVEDFKGRDFKTLSDKVDRIEDDLVTKGAKLDLDGVISDLESTTITLREETDRKIKGSFPLMKTQIKDALLQELPSDLSENAEMINSIVNRVSEEVTSQYLASIKELEGRITALEKKEE